MIKFYRVNMYNTGLELTRYIDYEEAITLGWNESRGYYRNKHKATYIMLCKRLENENKFEIFRRKKIINRINELLVEHPEVAI